jgi:fructokinase
MSQPNQESKIDKSKNDKLKTDKLKIVGVGEVLWDLLLTGPQLGGAPANFSYHAQALGAEAAIITRVGHDDYGREIIRRLGNMGLPEVAIQIDESAPTGTVKVELSGEGLTHYTVQQNVAWDCIAATPEALAYASSADAFCFGSLAQRSAASRHTIQKLLAATPSTALRIFDINLRQKFYSREVIEESLEHSNVLKMNDDELPTLAAMFNLGSSNSSSSCGADIPVRVPTPSPSLASTKPPTPNSQTRDQIKRLAEAFNLRLVGLTRGANGSLLYQRKDGVDRWSDCTSRPVKVVDTVGAGDSFTAALVHGLLRDMDLDEINSIANEVARYVCSQSGGTPTLPPEFANKFSLTAATLQKRIS